jgi:hypothetical protein
MESIKVTILLLEKMLDWMGDDAVMDKKKEQKSGYASRTRSSYSRDCDSVKGQSDLRGNDSVLGGSYSPCQAPAACGAPRLKMTVKDGMVLKRSTL